MSLLFSSLKFRKTNHIISGIIKNRVTLAQRFQNYFCSFQPSVVEQKWQQRWAAASADAAKRNISAEDDSKKEKYYVLSQFPYPSGNLHMGHARVYYISDVISRFERLKGKNVINPMGWDAFGLPAENAAISRNIEPSEWTYKNIAQMKEQMIKLGVSFDWQYELFTCREDYYKWTQWIFIQLINRGLAYKKEAEVNWDPVDQTVLANEQVDENGRSWRSGAVVQKRFLNQWFIKTTAYAKDLKEDLLSLEGWPSTVQEMQKGWIGYSTGTQLSFEIVSNSNNKEKFLQHLEVFTTRIDTICGVTFVALAYDHPSVEHLLEGATEEDLNEYKKMKETILIQQQKEQIVNKIGFKVPNVYAKNPISGEKVPVFLVDYVIKEYGTGAVMGVPAHDERDAEFAKKYQIPEKIVIETGSEQQDKKTNGLLINSGKYTGLDIQTATEQINQDLVLSKQGFVTSKTSMRDWLVSRQRYWGVPIPVIYCPSCGVLPVPENLLPVVLPEKLGNPVSLKNGNPLRQMESFLKCTCHKCGNKNAERETDTLDTFVDSSWYFLRFPDSQNSQKIFDSSIVDRWAPVDLYIGGMEHAILHLLYARFIHKFLHKEGLIPSHKEPFKQLIVQGLVKSKSYRLKSTGQYLTPEEAMTKQPEELDTKIEKMSKSKNNGVNPLDEINKNGADTLRMTLLFYGPNEKDIAWDTNLLKTFNSFLLRVWNIHLKIQTAVASSPSNKLPPMDKEKKIPVLKKVQGYVSTIENALSRKDRSFHVAIAREMELLNYLFDVLADQPAISQDFVDFYLYFLNTLHPFAPHITSEIAERLSKGEYKFTWPKELFESNSSDNSIGTMLTVKINVNNKFKGQIELQQESLEQASDNEIVAVIQKKLSLSIPSFKSIIKINRRNAYVINIMV